MTITVSSGVSSSGLTISAGDPLVVLNGGSSYEAFIESGGVATISAGGRASETFVFAGGTLTGAGDIIGADVLGLISDVTEVAGGIEVFKGGSAENVTVTSSGFITPGGLGVDSGGSATGTLVISGGQLAVEGTDSNASIGSGSDEFVVGGAASGDVIHSGGLLFAEGKISQETVQSGGTLVFGNEISGDVSVGIQTSALSLKGVTVASGATFEVSDPTVLSGATLSLAGTSAYSKYPASGVVDVEHGGTLLGPGVISGGIIAGSVSGVTVEFGRMDLVSGAAVNDLNVQGSSTLGIFPVTLEIEAGATTTGSVVTFSNEIVNSGGSATGTTLDDRSTEEVLAGATVTGTTLIFAFQDVGSGGVAYDTTLQVGGGGGQRVYSGGVASGDVIGKFGTALVYGGGSLVDATVSSGAVIEARSGGTTTGTTVSRGGVEEVGSKAVVSDTLVVAGGYEMVRGGVASGTVLAGGKEVVSLSGLAIGAVVSEGGELELQSAGTASAAGVSNGGKVIVEAGGLASGTMVSGGGFEYLLSGAVASGGVVSGSGKAIVSAGGTVIGLGLLAGGVLVDDGEVRIAGSALLAGALEGSGAIVETGGGVLTLDAPSGVFAGVAVISGGTVELASKEALGTGSVEFLAPTTGSAVLQIDAADAPKAGASFANTISNFTSAGEAIDLASIAYVRGAAAALAGSTLLLNEGGAAYEFRLAGSATASYQITSDGSGGTLITVSAPADAVTRFAQAAASFAPSTATKAASEPTRIFESQGLFMANRSVGPVNR
jgi:autotransporter passenger strand-loop-strand repeat protein